MHSSVIFAFMALGSVAHAHMEMSFPAPFRSKFNSFATNIDYSMTAPLTTSNYPCKGYQSDLGTPAGAATASFAAGSTHNMTIVGGAPHGGGSCQASLSYDKGATFTVITSYVGSCPLASGDTFDFTIPSDAPSGNALFAWSWVNQIGNREYYMNCASIDITAGAAKRAAASTAFKSRPAIFVANLGNGCATVENKDTVFPNPGPDVVSKSTTGDTGTLTGTCDAAAGGSSGSSGSSDGASAVASPATSAQASSAAPSTLATVASSAAAPAVTAPGGVFATVPASGGSAATSVASPSTPTSSPPSVISPVTSAAPAASSPAASTGTGSGSTATGSQSGACTSEGMFNCIGGTQFQQCASGTWSVVQAVASGTTCTAGQSMALDVSFASKSRRSIRRHLQHPRRHLQGKL